MEKPRVEVSCEQQLREEKEKTQYLAKKYLELKHDNHALLQMHSDTLFAMGELQRAYKEMAERKEWSTKLGVSD